MTSPFSSELETRLVRYASIDSQSDEDSPTTPSTPIQFDMLNLLKSELIEMGATDVRITEYGAVLATIPGTATGPTIGFLAHVDTAPQFNATGVKPRVIRGYNGGDITYPDNADLVLSPKDYPYLVEKQGDDLITASGTTLLGADDKAGVAVIMTAARHMLGNPDMKHAPIRIAFTPDEEIGRGVSEPLPKDLAVDFAYTFDGGELGELTYESFSADQAVVTVTGVSIHPGDAKGKMVNAITLAAKIVDMLPQANMTPESTDGVEGFIHTTEMTGGSSEMKIKMILRDFELDDLAAKGEIVKKICDAVAAIEPRATIACDIHPQYRNMRYWLEKDMKPVDLARDACKKLGIEPISMPVRGGTDGSRLTELGVPTPNLFTGMQNVHGPLEWVAVGDMVRATELCLKLAELAAGEAA